ncbi:glycosyl hydrolase family 26 [Flavobacterium salilacus subsp. salilacus]|uniref:glycosyl hydrolase n=1 Tax=Flavobacterium TaxID=237 RepID=UPI001074B56E|nr:MULTISPECIES: glycosyl hydrolase [Flavobacterium]KAF2519125.1 glycosyl hydrolase family 26 [Flavobacterium salilacus subsp. salilacus]MBE1613304.1 glycosyl hydrolase family 26 [Flavobacterium sp. SaA2.13]
MKNLYTSVLYFITIIASAQIAPVNKNASKEAKALLSYLYSINGKYLLSGQHSYNQDSDKYYNMVHDMTGKYPAIWGTDFIWNGTEDPGQRIVDDAIQKHKEGTIITLMWHAGRPTDEPPFGWLESIQGKVTDKEWKELTTPGTPLYTTFMARMDIVAGYLKQLRDANIPVLWRPLHEMNGVWFWWGNKKGKDGYQKLWHIMYDRFVNHHKLNNLIWVWNANAPRDIPEDEAFSYIDFYPGNAYVDIIATDIYHFDYEQKDYNEILELAQGKIVTLGEVGELPKKNILDVQPKWSWFMVWSNWLTDHNSKERVLEVYNNDKVLTRDEVTLYNK